MCVVMSRIRIPTFYNLVKLQIEIGKIPYDLRIEWFTLI